jgi:hypothetical protein
MSIIGVLLFLRTPILCYKYLCHQIGGKKIETDNKHAKDTKGNR